MPKISAIVIGPGLGKNADEVLKYLWKTNKPIVLDGEIISKNFQELMKQIHRKSSTQNTDASLFLFDTFSKGFGYYDFFFDFRE